MSRDHSVEERPKGRSSELPELEFTGERIVPGKTPDALFREHEQRYVFAGQYVAGKDVLDIACGSGVGSSYLKGAGARCVWGLDIDPAAIAYAGARYPECQFAECDATRICLEDCSVDVVVSFETLEHLSNQSGFIAECRRVLKLGGTFVCSTPNRDVYQWQRKNPYHFHELDAVEFGRMVGCEFEEVTLFSQAKRLMPVYLARELGVRTLDVLGLKAIAKLATSKIRSERVDRPEFERNGQHPFEEYIPRRNWQLSQPMYIVCVARKAIVP